MSPLLVKVLILSLILALMMLMALTPGHEAPVAAATFFIWLILACFVAAPIRTYLTYRIRIPAEIILIDQHAAGLRLPDKIDRHLSQAHAMLSSQGFDLAGVMCLPNLVTGARAFLGLFVNRQTQETAKATFIVTTGTIMRQRKLVEYTTRFQDGSIIDTHNSPDLNIYKTVPQYATTTFPGLDDLDLLYALHHFLVRRSRGVRTPECRLDREFHGDPIAAVQQGFLEFFTTQIGTGYLVHTADGFRLTIKGAFLATCKLLWPLKPFLLARRRRLAARLLEEFRAEAPFAG